MPKHVRQSAPARPGRCWLFASAPFCHLLLPFSGRASAREATRLGKCTRRGEPMRRIVALVSTPLQSSSPYERTLLLLVLVVNGAVQSIQINNYNRPMYKYSYIYIYHVTVKLRVCKGAHVHILILHVPFLLHCQNLFVCDDHCWELGRHRCGHPLP